jgi:hypothetical protein
MSRSRKLAVGKRGLISQHGLPILIAAIFCWMLYTIYLITVVMPTKDKEENISIINNIESSTKISTNVPKKHIKLKHTSTINNTDRVTLHHYKKWRSRTLLLQNLHLRLHINRLSRINPLYAQSPNIFETNRKRNPLP